MPARPLDIPHTRPAQASLTLRPAGLLNRLKRPLSRGSSPAGYPTEPLVSYQINRQLSGWNLPPLVIRAFGAHCQFQTCTKRSQQTNPTDPGGPRAHADSSPGFRDLDHERDITLAIHAIIPDLIRDTNRHVTQAGSGCLTALARRFEWNSRAKPI